MSLCLSPPRRVPAQGSLAYHVAGVDPYEHALPDVFFGSSYARRIAPAPRAHCLFIQPGSPARFLRRPPLVVLLRHATRIPFLAVVGLHWPMMAKTGHSDAVPGLAEEAVLGLLLAVSGRLSLPARPWPLAAACQSLANGLGTDSPLRDAAAQAATVHSDDRVETWLWMLAAQKLARPEGRGISARWVVDPEWVSQWRLVADALAPDESAAWERAGQVLTRCLSIWAKTTSAAVRGAGRSTSND